MKHLLFVLGLLLLPVIALAQTTTSTVGTSTVVNPLTLIPSDLPGLVSLMAKTFQSGEWMVASGLLLSLVVAGFKMLGLNKLIPKKYNKWVAGVLAMLTSIAVGLMAKAAWWLILSTGVGVGVTAIGGWEIVFEPVLKFLKKKFPKAFSKLPGDVDLST